MNLPSIDEALEELGLERPRTNKIECPSCGSSDTPALHLYEDHFYCFSCGKTGDGIGLIALYTNQNVRTLLKQRSKGKRQARIQPRVTPTGVHKAVKRQWSELNRWWFRELHEIYKDSQLWAFERALDLYSDMFDQLTEQIEGWGHWVGEEPLAPFKAEQALARFKEHLERAIPFEEKRARETR